jgi:hypothetical protein
MTITAIDFLLLVSAPNGSFIMCDRCRCVIPPGKGAQGVRWHLSVYHSTCNQPGALNLLLQSRLELRMAIAASGIPAARPDDSPPLACLPVLDGYECLLYPPANPHRLTNQGNMDRHLDKAHAVTGPREER